jgi:hypothetical protein
MATQLAPEDGPEPDAVREKPAANGEQRSYVVLTLLITLAVTFIGVGATAAFQTTPDRWLWGVGYILFGLVMMFMTVYYMFARSDKKGVSERSPRRMQLYVGVLGLLLGLWPIVQLLAGGDVEPNYLASAALMVVGGGIALSSCRPLQVDFLARFRFALRRERGFLVAMAVVSFSAIVVMNLYSLRDDFDVFVRPRHVSKWQVESLKRSLKEPFVVIVKSNPRDEEATTYAGEIYNALLQTAVLADLSTADADPTPTSVGICNWIVGEKPQPQGARQPPRPSVVLWEAFHIAGMPMNCGAGGQDGPQIKIYVLVGHRPVALGQRQPLLVRIGSWIALLGRV